jgi:hypothetical protein
MADRSGLPARRAVGRLGGYKASQAASQAPVVVMFGDYSIRRLKRLRKRLWSWHHLVTTWVSGYYSACITLTYAPSQAWHRQDISRFLNALRGYYKRRGWRFIYFWVAELQQRGGGALSSHRLHPAWAQTSLS